MMNAPINPSNRDYRYLDTDDDRRDVVADVHRVRQAVIQLAESVPPNRRYEPRYHGWSLGAMLAHLYLTDRIALWQIGWALAGIHPPFSLKLLNVWNDATARLFQNRLTETTIRSLHAHERKIVGLIMRVPVDKLSTPVYYPPEQTYLTAERVLQAYFIFHWQEHLATIRRVEGIFYEPPKRHDTL